MYLVNTLRNYCELLMHPLRRCGHY